jgi:hypothetical protein
MNEPPLSADAIATLRAALLRRGYGESLVTELSDYRAALEATRLLTRPEQIGSVTLEEFDAIGQWVMAFHEMCAELVSAAFQEAGALAQAAADEWLEPR